MTMNKLLALLKPYTFVLLSLFFVIFSLWPMFFEIGKADTIRPERRFELVHNFYTDFNFYLSRIRQGLEGHLTVHEKYTSEPHQGSFVHVFYLVLGWIGKWVHINWHRTSDIYHATRTVLGFVLLIVTAEIAKRSFTKYGLSILGFLFAVTASTYPKLVTMDDGSLRIGGYMAWWSVMDSLQRITFIPHLLVGQILLAFVLFAGSDLATIAKPRNWIFLGILSFVLGFIFPPGLVFVYAGFAVMTVLEFWFDRPVKKNFRVWFGRHVFGRLFLSIIALPSMAYLQLMVTFYPWKELALADVLRPLPFQYYEYLQAVGIMLPLGVLGAVIALKKRDKLMILPVAWVLAWAALLFIFQFIPQQSPLRFSEMIVHIPLGILSVYLFYQLYLSLRYSIEKYIKNKGFDKKKSKLLYTFPDLIYVIPLGLLVLNLMHMYSSWLWQRDFVVHKIVAAYPLVPTGSYVMYPLNDFIDAIVWLQDNTSRDTAILSQTTAGNYIPVYSGNTVYVGHDNTVGSQEKKMYVKAFFSGTMPPDDARQFLSETGLHYIFFGPQEREDAGGKNLDEFYPFLTKLYENGNVFIYEYR